MLSAPVKMFCCLKFCIIQNYKYDFKKYNKKFFLISICASNGAFLFWGTVTTRKISYNLTNLIFLFGQNDVK